VESENEHYVVTGEFSGGMNFPRINTALSSNGDRDVFLAQYDASNDWTWALSFGGTMVDVGTDVVISRSAEKDIYVAGYFHGQVTGVNEQAI
jgi:hypothetical protein